MTYQQYTTLPAWELMDVAAGIDSPRAGAALYASNEAPPSIGERIVVTMNNCGPAIVTGYFVQDGYLGILCDLLDAPDWHKKQNKGNPKGHVFGPEFRLDGPYSIRREAGSDYFNVTDTRTGENASYPTLQRATAVAERDTLNRAWREAVAEGR